MTKGAETEREMRSEIGFVRLSFELFLFFCRLLLSEELDCRKRNGFNFFIVFFTIVLA